MSPLPKSVVSIVTFHSARYIEPCIRSLLAQTLPPGEIVVTDNHSADQTPEIIESCFGSEVKLLRNQKNFGFSHPHNQVIRSCDSQYILILNPDTKLQPDFLEKLTLFMEANPGLGSATGKLLRMDDGFQPLLRNNHAVIDSTGMIFLPNQRHCDRGSGQEDIGQFSKQELVFGTTAAAGFYRRSMLEDIALRNEYFDEGFFVYREDVDLAWRAILYGWHCGFCPEAIGYHIRFGIPERRHLLSSEINYHSVKNRFLLRIKNMPRSVYYRHFLAIALRDLLVIGYSLIKEHSSLAAFSYLWQNRTPYQYLRRQIAIKSRIAPSELEKWISWHPVARSFSPPVPPLQTK